jgi:hypothetical protein
MRTFLANDRHGDCIVFEASSRDDALEICLQQWWDFIGEMING